MEDRKDPATRPAPAASPADPEAPPTKVLPPSGGPVLPPGTPIGDRYRVLGTLGVGGMGVVYRVHDDVLDVDLALKMLLPEIARDEGFLQRFRNELLVARQVTHRHVVRNHDLGVHGDSYFLTMDLVEGRSLQDVLREEGTLEPDRAVAVARQVAAALGEAHRQDIVHRDLKPANILLDAAGDAFVTDFGIARATGSVGVTRTGEVLGTPDYLSPEQARGEAVDGRSDLYSLGLILIEMLSGKLPFRGGTIFEVLTQHALGKLTSLAELGVEIPPALEAVIERCVEKNPDRRYQTTGELIADLDALDRGPRRWRRRGLRRAAWAAAVLLAAGLGGLALQRFLPAPTSDAHDASVVAPPAIPALAARPLHSVAVMPFTEEAGRSDLAWASTGVAEMLATTLAESENLRVVESVRVVQILQDLGFQPGRLRSEEIDQLAELLEVDRIVLGKLRSVGDRVQLEMSLLDADPPGSPPRVVDTRDGRAEELFDLVGQLGAGLREALAVPQLAQAPRSPTASAAAMQWYAQGIEALSRGESLKAAPALQRAVAEDPGFTLAWVRLSQAQQELGRRAEALEAAQRAVESAAGAGGRIGYEARAQEALLRGDPDQAQRFLEELVERYPNDSQAHVALAEAYGQQGKLVEAKERLELAVSIDPSEPRAWYLLGRFGIMTGDARRAVDEYLTRALVQQQRFGNEQGQAEVHNALGVGYRRLGLIDQAVESYRKAAEIRERVGDRRGLAVTLHNLGFIQINRGDYDAAEANVRRALDIHTELGNQSGIGRLTDVYGWLQELRGRYAEALEHYRRSLQVRGELGDERAVAESRTNVGSAYYLLGQYDNALLYLGEARELFEQNEDRGGVLLVLPSLGACELARGNWSEAASLFLAALELSRELVAKDATAVTRGHLGQLAQLQGRYSAALSSYGEALEILEELGDRRARVEVDLREVEALLELGALDRAGVVLDRAAEWEPGRRNPAQRSRLLSLRGRWHLQRREVATARKLIDEASREASATQAPPLIVEARIGSGRAAMAVGETELALQELASALAEAESLGNAVLQLRAGEALAALALARGEPDLAEETLRKTLKVAERCGSYARSYRLHQLLSAVLLERGAAEAAAEQRQAAQAELARVRDNLDDGLGQSFDRLPEVRGLLAAGR